MLNSKLYLFLIVLTMLLLGAAVAFQLLEMNDYGFFASGAQ